MIQQQQGMTMQINSKGENVAEIQSLSSEVERLSRSVASWNTGIVIMMVIAAIAATGLVLVSSLLLSDPGNYQM